jgi:predicted AlkP superfamily pyrophosphatase or phosphodiesterase
VTVGAKSIDYNIPEYWRAHDHEDAKLERALATPGLPETLEREGGVALVDTGDTSEAADALKAEDAAALYKLKAPVFFTLHLSSLDDVEHEFGPGSPQAKTALMRLDAEIGQIIAAARTVEPGLVVAVVSDHGFGPVEHDINLGAAFVQAGLISLGPDGQPASWEASPWNSGGSSAVVLARPGDAVLRRRVETLLTALAADPASGVARIASRADIARMGGGGGIDFFVDAKIGYTFGSRYSGPLVTPGSEKGSHGYFPDRPEMHATLILEGPGVPKKALGAVDMRDVAPTLAKILGVALPDADGTPLL